MSVFLITERWVSVGPHVLKSPPGRLITCSQGVRDDFPESHIWCQRSSPTISGRCQCGSLSNVRKLKKNKQKTQKTALSNRVSQKEKRQTRLFLRPFYRFLFSPLSLRKSCINHCCSDYSLERLRDSVLHCNQSYASVRETSAR